MRVQVQAYRERYGSAFSAVGAALINAVMPLCPQLAGRHLGLSDQQPAKRVHPRDSLWLEGLAKGQLESTFAQMAQQHRFGATQVQLESILVNRTQNVGPLIALTNRMRNVQEKWIKGTAPVFCSHLPHPTPDKLILNVFATEWALATAHELSRRATLCAEAYTAEEKRRGKLNLETSKMRQAIILWSNAVLDSRWREALTLMGLIEDRWIKLDVESGLEPHERSVLRPLTLTDQEERCAAALHQAMKWVILGKLGAAFMSLYHAVFAEGEIEEEQVEGEQVEGEQVEGEQVEGEQVEKSVEETLQSSDPEAHHVEESGGEESDPQDAETAESSPEDMTIYQHALAAFEAIEMLCAAAQPPYVPIPLQAGDLVGGRAWSLEEPLGDGLWKARDREGHYGCVEELWPLGDETWSQQTQTQSLALNGITHSHIAPIQDWGIDPESGRWFIVSPFVYGESLIEKVDRAPLSEAQARSFFLQVTDALKRGLKSDITHGQLRPENLLFYSEDQLALTRWGVHRAGLEQWRTTSDQTPWRRAFCAPEVWRGAPNTHGDVYSLGSLLAFSLSPDSLSLEGEWDELLQRSDPELPPRNWIKLDLIPTAFKDLVKRATALDPDERYPNVSAFEQALRELKPLYNYRGEFGERDDLTLMEVVSLILSKPKARHSIWQGHLNSWESWVEVDEIEQVVNAALQQREEAEKAEVEKAEREESAPSAEEKPQTPRSPRSPRRSLVKKRPLSGADQSPSPAKRRRSPRVNPYLQGGSVAEAPGTIHTVTFEGVPLQLCYIPPGDFLMGSPRSPLTPRLERPQHVVSITRPLLIGQTPITQGFYAALMGHNPSYFEDWEAPVEQLSWREAAEFCNHLSSLDGLEPVYEFKEETLEEVVEVEEIEDDDAGGSLAQLAAASRAKRSTQKGSRTSKRERASESNAEGAETLSAEGSEGSRGESGEIGEDKESLGEDRENTEATGEATSEATEEIPEPVSGDLTNESETLELSAERERDPSLDEKRRQILEEGEAELDEKFKRRHQLQKIKEPPRLKVWVRCHLQRGGYRLPTEAEWEYTARAGSAHLYPGGDHWREVAWSASGNEEGTQPVARLKPNGWGLYDLGGNVAEWCTDDRRAYTRNCADPHEGSGEEWTLLDTRAIRGGGWRHPELHARVTARGRCLADQRRNHIGLRVARPLLPINPFHTVTTPLAESPEANSTSEEHTQSPSSE